MNSAMSKSLEISPQLRQFVLFSLLSLGLGWAGVLVVQYGMNGGTLGKFSPSTFVFLFSPTLASLAMFVMVPATRAYWRDALHLGPTPLWSLCWLVLPLLALGLNGSDGWGIYGTYIGGPLGEEPGWRIVGQALAIGAFGVRRGLFALGIVWGLWHAPLFAESIDSGMYDTGLLGLGFYLVYCVVLSPLFYAVHQRSNGSVWACIGLHASINTFTDQELISGLVITIGATALTWYTHIQKPITSEDFGAPHRKDLTAS